jgi:GntR family transcriptional regulator
MHSHAFERAMGRGKPYRRLSRSTLSIAKYSDARPVTKYSESPPTAKFLEASPASKPPEASPIAKYHRVEVVLADRIRSGFYANGAMPSERSLAEEFTVARVTIRHALRRLEEQGLVSREQRQGHLIVQHPGAPSRTRLLREHIDQFLDSGQLNQYKVLRFQSVAATLHVAEALGVQAGAAVLRVLRVRSRSGSPLTYTESFIAPRLAHMISRADLAKTAVIQLLENAGVKVGAANQSIRAELCPEDIAAELGVRAHEPVFRLERIVFDETGAPVHFLVGWYRADRFEIQMQMSRGEDLTRVWMQTQPVQSGGLV